MTREQLNNVLKGIRTDLKLFKGLGTSHYMERAEKRLKWLIGAKKDYQLAIDKHDLAMVQLEVEKITLG